MTVLEKIAAVDIESIPAKTREYARKIQAWCVENRPSTPHVSVALDMAIGNLFPMDEFGGRMWDIKGAAGSIESRTDDM